MDFEELAGCMYEFSKCKMEFDENPNELTGSNLSHFADQAENALNDYIEERIKDFFRGTHLLNGHV